MSVSAGNPLEERRHQEAALIREVWQALRLELAKVGFADALTLVPSEVVNSQLRKDPYDGSEAFYGEWVRSDGRRLGTLMIHGDGNVFADFDVLRVHPENKRWFIESVNTWGRAGALRSELKLLPALDP